MAEQTVVIDGEASLELQRDGGVSITLDAADASLDIQTDGDPGVMMQATDMRPATTEMLGGIIVGDDLSITPEGRLSVIKADRAAGDNSHPITAAAVYTEIGNISALLRTI